MPQRRSALPSTWAVLAVCAWCCKQCSKEAFLLGARPAAGRGASVVTRQVNIFEGISFPSFDQEGQEGSETGWDGARSAREADGDNGRIVECNMPLGIEFEEKGKGDIYIKDVDQASDAWGQGVRPGAQLTFISATFGDEMWNTRGVGMTQFMTVLRSRFGSSIKLALEKENQNFISGFFDSLSPKKEKKTTKSKEQLMDEFEKGEAELEGKTFWNPFR